MLCERCKKNEATFYYHEEINGVKKTYHLCGACAEEMEKRGEIGKMSDPFAELDSFWSEGTSMANLLSGFFGGKSVLSGAKSAEVQTEKKCPSCGMTLRSLSEHGMAGCPMCYSTFEKELAPTISRIHGGGSHTGRVPAKFRAKAEEARKIATLEQEQRDAIESENYERAAEIRDTLRKMRGAE